MYEKIIKYVEKDGLLYPELKTVYQEKLILSKYGWMRKILLEKILSCSISNFDPPKYKCFKSYIIYIMRSSVKDVAKYPSFLFKPIKAYK